jgi:histidyl-tRNA synthetase
LQPIMELSGSNLEKLDKIATVIAASETGLQGVEEMRTIFSYLERLKLPLNVEIDLTLARGLNYYTGAIFEVKANEVEIGSITGGGRYDNLTGIFGMPGVSGVGISFGADRIYDVMTQLDLFPKETVLTTQVMFTNFGPREELYALPMVARLRSLGVLCELYPDQDKMKKQLVYANRKEIPYVILAGDSEIDTQKFTLKNMTSGDQQLLSAEELENFFVSK